MKVLIVLTYYLPHWTGLTKYAARLAKGLVKRGYKVEVICSRHRSELPKEEISEGVKIFRVPYIFPFLRTVIMPLLPWELFKRIKSNDAVFVFLPYQEVVLAVVLARLFHKKIFLVHNGDLVLPEKGGWINRLVEKIYFWSTSFGIKYSDGIIIHTKDYAENSKLLSLFKNKWRVILPPFTVPKISSKQVENFIKKNKLKGKELIGFSGRFVEEKGVDYLLKAIPLVVKKKPNAHFIFAGEHKVFYENFWERIEPLIKKYQKNITLLGLLSEEEVFVFYKSLEVLVMPSRSDCFPFAQVEAMLLQTPSVCTNIPGARWAVRETGMGCLVEPRNYKALASGILEIIQNKSKYLKNYHKVKKVFNYEKSLSEYEKLLKD